MEELQIGVAANEIEAGVIKDALHRALDGRDDLKLSRKDKDRRVRSLEPTIMVAIVGGVSAALSALITSVLQIAREHKAGKIVLQSKTGARIEVPSNISREKLDELVATVQDMERPAFLLEGKVLESSPKLEIGDGH